jgi:DNA polymerase-3 subunit gamma/tau
MMQAQQISASAATTGSPYPASSIQHPASNVQKQASSIQHPESSIQHPSSSVQHPKSSSQHPGTVKMKDIEKEFTSTLSIKNPLKKEQDAPTAQEESTKYQSATPFTQTDLSLAWDEFAEKLKNDSPHLYSTLRKFRPKLLPEWQIEFTLENKILDDELNLKKGELMEFLCTRLNNFKIQLFTKIAENLKDSKPYTDKEKFEKMAEKNPGLRTLREELDLEIEY